MLRNSGWRATGATPELLALQGIIVFSTSATRENNMKQLVLDELDRILTISLFANCGSWQPTDGLTIGCTNINAAIKSIRTETWNEAIQLSADNHITNYLFAYCREIYNTTWRPVNDYLYPITGKYIYQCLDKYNLINDDRDTIKYSANIDIKGYLLELQHSEYVPPGYYTSVFKYYEQGFLPCGWEGEYPAGKLIVF